MYNTHQYLQDFRQYINGRLDAVELDYSRLETNVKYLRGNASDKIRLWAKACGSIVGIGLGSLPSKS
jgi:hypothetical protein